MNKEKYKYLSRYDLDGYLIEACESKNMELVKYLLTSQELPKTADINTFNRAEKGRPLRDAFSNKDFELIDYLLTSPELKEHADIHIANDDIFKTAFFKKDEQVLKYLIFNCEIKRTLTINELIDANRHILNGYALMVTYVENLFSIRNLNKDLNKELEPTSNNEKVKKNKI